MNDRLPSLFRPAWPWAACLLVALVWPASQAWTGLAAAAAGNRRLVVEIGPSWIGITFGRIGKPIGASIGPARSWRLQVHRLTAADRQALAFPQIYPMPGEDRFYCPLGMVTLGAGMFAAGLLASRLRRSLGARPGRCRQCGYDLRATPERCPECGAVGPVERPI